MKIADLGKLSGPVLVFGGPYSNLQAVTALREVAERSGIAPMHVICTGDIVAYCAEAAATLAEIRDWGCTVVAGNCEKQLGAGAGDCGCGFEDGSTCDRLSAGWYAHADAQIGAEDRAWMRGRPDFVLFHHAGLRHAVLHGGLSDISRFLWPVSPEAEFAEELALIRATAGPVDRVFAGHCGLAFSRIVEGVEWVNAGAIGMPANAGRATTQYAMLDEGVTFQELSYDHSAAHRAMVAAGLTQGYHEALLSGYWPSEDVLPPDLRRVSA
ncbi:metallophosphoesterase family protein [Roseovarius aestuariivivens]|uniref:metallophosphoesterase family protein n=1 Tax=Roseovarius aestuariivivens TaxID=1888910 RepID=UPI0010815E79|nr:metallophosphoesterase family protein [Roseovarius aestuariivivens]